MTDDNFGGGVKFIPHIDNLKIILPTIPQSLQEFIESKWGTYVYS